MFRPIAPSHRRPARRGTSILLIALIMLTLFSAVGTAYVFYALREAKLAQARKEEQGAGTPPLPTAPDPTNTINAFFGALIYDVTDGNGNANDLLNGLRGHSIARSMYGYDESATSHTTPWAGVGLFHEDATAGSYASYSFPSGTDRAQFVNYTLMTLNNKPFLIDPEYMGARTFTTATTVPTFTASSSNYVGKHAGYSYPDLKDFFAASVDPATGQVLVPSFHRPWLFGGLDYSNGGATGNNNNWTNTQGRLLTLRPRPAEHPHFPRVPPNGDGSYTGDVQNMPGGVGVQKMDSLWINMGLPIITLPNGQKVQPLVAPLIVPMDGLFNASAHGNLYTKTSSGTQHGSYAGYGPWEVNLGYGLTVSTDASGVINARGTPQQRTGATTRSYAPYSADPLPSYAPVAWDSTPITSPLSYPMYGSPNVNVMLGLPNFYGSPTNPPNAPGKPNPYQNTNSSTTDAFLTNHPSLYNPTEWSTTSGSPRAFPVSDIRRIQRYASTPNWYAQASLASFAPTEIQGNSSNTYIYNTQQTTSDSYRLDSAHYTRGLFTTHAFDLDRPKLVPNFANIDTSALTYNLSTNKAGTVSPGSTGTYPSPGPLGTAVSSDFTSATQWSNVMAVLGSVDLNRPLADYRNNLSSTLANDTTNATQANIDRQQLARDIFGRLAVATGAGIKMGQSAVQVTASNLSATNSYQYSIPGSITNTSSQYYALRYLAQLSANIVDYIDNDDISTAFAWNPSAPTDLVFGVEKPRLVLNEAYAEITNDPNDAVNGANATSFPMNPAQVRFWAELLNPTATLFAPSSGTTTTVSPLGDGSVSLSAYPNANGSLPYQIQIRRETRQTGPFGMGVTQDTGAIGANQAPALGLYGNSAQNGAPANPTGSFTGTNATADAICQISGQGATGSISPNNATYAPAAASLAAGGIVLIGPPPPSAQKQGSAEFYPNGGVWQNMIASQPLSTAPASPGMGYTFNLPTSDTTFSNAEFKRHIILLQRLANPYAAYNATTNPYITVDMMDYVPAFDAVHRGKTDAMDRGAWSTTNTNGYDPVSDATPGNNRFAVGKVQPYAGHAIITNQTNGAYAYNPINRGTGPLSTASYNTYTFGNQNTVLASMVLPQTLPTGTAAASGQPLHTFGYHNSKNGPTGSAPTVQTFTAGTAGPPVTPASLSDTLMTPFDWYVHMDRPLVNQIELFEVRDTPPYRVTDQFILGATPSTTNSGITYTAGLGRWRYTNGLARGLEYLSVKPYTVGVPHGGRVPGRINLNVLQDQRVFNGLFDPQGGNGFDLGHFVNATGSGSGSAWSGWMNTRDTGGVTTRTRADGTAMATTGAPGQTVFDMNVATNGSSTTYGRPFLSFGAPAVSPAGSSLGTIAYGATGTSGSGSNADMTILRADSNTSPYLYTNAKSTASGLKYPSTHLNGPGYMQTEAVRKILNNTTTVSHTYLVYLTIGYFNVLSQTAPTGWPTTSAAGTMPVPPTLGAEAFLSVPGDMRQKVVAVIDMSNMTTTPLTGRPFFTSLEATAYVPATNPTTTPVQLNVAGIDGSGNIYADGVAINVQAGNTLYLGYGSEQQTVTVTAVAKNQITVTGLQFTAWAGTCLSNATPGYPGPQQNFNYLSSTYQPVLPYIERLK